MECWPNATNVMGNLFYLEHIFPVNLIAVLLPSLRGLVPGEKNVVLRSCAYVVFRYYFGLISSSIVILFVRRQSAVQTV